MNPIFSCRECKLTGEENRFVVKIISIMYRPKHENIQAFKSIKCPNCHQLVTIIYETLDCERRNLK